jgi:TetR/AcrR family transcriptional repressor of mexJK operon
MNEPAPPIGPGRPKDMAKRQAILEAAQTLFLRQGYEGSSMDAIATEAGVSKLTVYSHFNDKESLYIAAIKAKCEQQLPPLIFDQPEDAPLETVLMKIGIAFVELINSPESIALHRLLIGTAEKEWGLAHAFHEIGPLRVVNGMADLLTRLHRNGRLQVVDPQSAAEHFFCLLKGGVNFRLLIGCGELPSAEERARHISDVVGLFLRAYRC